MDSISKNLIFAGLIFVLIGLFWHFSGGRLPLGRLPGDVRFESDNTKIYIPVTTSLLLSLLVSVLAYFFRK